MVNGWIEKPLGDLFDFSGGFSASRANLSTKGYPYLHYGDIHGSTRTFVDVCADKSIPRLDIDLNKISNASLLNNGDVVFVDASEDDEGASRHIVVRNADDLPFISGLHTIIAKAKTDELDNKFKEYCFQTAIIKSQFKFYAVGTKVTGVSKITIGKIILSYPQDKSEQRRIAAVLSDTDELIATLEKTIAKKRAIKQGTMQEMLTGKRRLPKFSGEWVEKPLQNCLTSIPSRNYQIPQGEINLYGSYPVISQSDNYVEGYSEQKDKLFINNDGVIIFGDHTLIVKYVDFNFIVGADGVKILVVTDNNVKFIYYAICEAVKQIELGYARHYNWLLEINVSLPTIEEQTAIASILSDMDAEIDKLTAKLKKLRNIKQGMMSELLTRRIRLPGQKTETASETNETLKIIKLPKQTTKKVASKTSGHNQQFDDAVMIAGIVNVLYSDKYPLGRKKVQKCLYLLRRHQDESTAAFKKKTAGPYADEVRYKGGEPIAIRNGYIKTQKGNQGTKFAVGEKVSQALGYIENWGKQADIQWVEDKFKYKGIEKLELLATVDMAICDLTEAGTPISVASIKNLIANNAEWKAKLKKQTFSDDNIADAIRELQILLLVENQL